MRPDRLPRQPLGWIAAAAAVALGLSACTGPEAPDDDGPPATSSPSASAGPGAAPSEGATPTQTVPPGAAPAGLDEFYDQELTWEACHDGHECATVTAPLDYDDPDAGEIGLAVVRSAEAGRDAPHLLLNPGGPGLSGVNTVVDSLDFVVSDELRQNFTMVGFDPRGVWRSEPVECMTDQEMDQARQEHVDLSTDAGLEQGREDAAQFAAACDENTGEVLGQVDTDSAAQDMDLIRGVLGDDRLNFLGFSYGSVLGASYAEQFPQNVGRMVLDGAMDPALTPHQITLAQAEGFERSLRSWVEWCLAGDDCPLSGSPENGMQQVQRLLRQVEAEPMVASDGRQVPVTTFVSGLIVPLYSEQSWPTLSQAVAEAMAGRVDAMLSLADQNAGRDADGNYPANVNAAFAAVNCLDAPMPSDTATLRAQAEELDDASPTLGRFLAYGALTCDQWPEDPVSEPAPVTAAGADPILVIGTTGDPVTPHEWASALAGQLESGVLLTWDGEGHTAYGRAGDCIGSAVDDYFVDGTVPQDGLTCG